MSVNVKISVCDSISVHWINRSQWFLFLSFEPYHWVCFILFFTACRLFSISTPIYAEKCLRITINVLLIDRANLLFALTSTVTDWSESLIWSIKWFPIVMMKCSFFPSLVRYFIVYHTDWRLNVTIWDFNIILPIENKTTCMRCSILFFLFFFVWVCNDSTMA